MDGGKEEVGPTRRMWMEIGSERERRELMSDGIGGGVAAEREDLREDWREVKESLDECGSIWDCRVRNVSRPGTEAEFVVVKRRRRRKREIAVVQGIFGTDD